MNELQSIREVLAKAIDWDSAHAKFDDAVKDFPPELRGVRPPGVQHSAWELLEHLRITLWDIVEFTRDGKHVSPQWPSGYWPGTPAPPNGTAWDESVATHRSYLRTMAEIARDESVDLLARIPHGTGQTTLREILVVIDHNSWHLGQLLMLRRMLEA